jgi:pilus assembly protein CpaE
VQLIVNRHDKNGDIRIKDLEEAFDTPVLRTMPNHYEAAAKSVNQGVPLMRLVPDSPLSAALQQMARDLTGDAAPQQEAGLVARFLKRRAA